MMEVTSLLRNSSALYYGHSGWKTTSIDKEPLREDVTSLSKRIRMGTEDDQS